MTPLTALTVGVVFHMVLSVLVVYAACRSAVRRQWWRYAVLLVALGFLAGVAVFGAWFLPNPAPLPIAGPFLSV